MLCSKCMLFGSSRSLVAVIQNCRKNLRARKRKCHALVREWWRKVATPPVITLTVQSNSYFTGPWVIAVWLSSISNTLASILLRTGLAIAAATIGPSIYAFRAASLSNR